jgi:hypothetical protein
MQDLPEVPEMSKLTIEGEGGPGAKAIKLDDLDISNMVTGMSVDVVAGELPSASVSLLIDNFEINIEVDTITITINGTKHDIAALKPLYDLLKARFEVAQRLNG